MRNNLKVCRSILFKCEVLNDDIDQNCDISIVIEDRTIDEYINVLHYQKIVIDQLKILGFTEVRIKSVIHFMSLI